MQWPFRTNDASAICGDASPQVEDIKTQDKEFSLTEESMGGSGLDTLGLLKSAPQGGCGVPPQAVRAASRGASQWLDNAQGMPRARRTLEFTFAWALRPEARSQCERTYMKSTSESLSRPETSNGIAAEGNCVVVRRGGEQPEADLRSQTRVNPIRFTTAASLLASGEACRTSGNRFLPHPSFTGEKRAVVDGWGENAGKVSCGRVEICPGRNSRERSRAEVRAVIVAMKRGNACGARDGRKVERQKP